jgi:type IV secretory pathway TrbF-like protein
MSLKNFIFGNKKSTDKGIQNPFVKGAEGRREWNDRYMNMAKSIKNWQIAFFAAMVMAVILALVVAKIATESKVQPFVVETNQGMPYAIKPLTSLSNRDQRLINFAVNQFIINAKTIIADTHAEKILLDKVYAYSADNTIGFLHDYYQTNNPFTVAAQYTVTVDIINSMPIGSRTWQVTWDETKRNTAAGNILGVTRWMANLTYKFGDVDPKFMTDNPFGLYITNISWSQSQTN